MMSVYGKKCLRPGCTGRVAFEVGPGCCSLQDSWLKGYFSTRTSSYTISSGIMLICSTGKLL